MKFLLGDLALNSENTSVALECFCQKFLCSLVVARGKAGREMDGEGEREIQIYVIQRTDSVVRTQYNTQMIKKCTPGTYVILLKNVTPINLI